MTTAQAPAYEQSVGQNVPDPAGHPAHSPAPVVEIGRGAKRQAKCQADKARHPATVSKRTGKQAPAKKAPAKAPTKKAPANYEPA
jgi:hypothetical protein